MDVVLWNGVDEDGYVQAGANGGSLAFGEINGAKIFRSYGDGGICQRVIDAFCAKHNLCIVEV